MTTVFHIIPHRAFTEPKVRVVDISDAGRVSIATLQIDGLLCSACAANVRKRLERTPGVHSATVDLETARATVAFEPGNATTDDLVRAVESAVILRPLRRLLARFGGRRLAREAH